MSSCPKSLSLPHNLVRGPFKVAHVTALPYCVIAHLLICPPIWLEGLWGQGAYIYHDLVISLGPGLMPGTRQGFPNDLLNEWVNDLEMRKKKGKNGDAWHLPPSATSSD